MQKIVAIPARNEAGRIADCLRALSDQRRSRPDAVLVLVNNSTDGTAVLLRHLAPSLAFELLVREVDLPVPSAGAARRLAMAEAADLAGSDGLLLTTDADGAVAPDWLLRTTEAMEAGAATVMGRAVIDPVEALALPPRLHEDDARECRYAALLDRLASILDPDPDDPWPRHDEESGASMAVRVAAWRRAGGVPDLPTGEDRAFAAALRAIDAPIRHAPDVRVTVSGRLIGRAQGGMADTMRRRLAAADPFLDGRLEPAADRARRLRLRAAARRAWAEGGTVAGLGLSGAEVSAALRLPFFGAAWQALEAASPVLASRPVPAADVMAETADAEALLEALAASGPEAVEPV